MAIALINRALCWSTDNCSIPTITLAALSQTTFTTIDNFDLNYSSVGSFTSGEKFIVQFSDAFGNFSPITKADSVTLGNETNAAGTINVSVPSTLAAGGFYGIRIANVTSGGAVRAYSNILRPIVILDQANFPPKIVYIGGSSTVADADTSVYNRLVNKFGAETGLDVEYRRINDVTLQNIAGASLIVISGTVDDNNSTKRDALDLIATAKIPVLNMNGEVVDDLDMASAEGGSNGGSGNPRQYGVEVINDTIISEGYTIGYRPFYEFTIDDVDGNNDQRNIEVVAFGNIGSGAIRIVTREISSTDYDAVFLYPEGAEMTATEDAPARRMFFALSLDEGDGQRDRYPYMREEFADMLDAGIYWLLGSGEPQKINTPTSTVGSALCTGNTFTVDYTINGTFDATNQFQVEISSPDGSFTDVGYPIIIGSVTSSVATPITATIPIGMPAGSDYKIRVSSTFPAKRSPVLQESTPFVLVDDRDFANTVSDQSVRP